MQNIPQLGPRIYGDEIVYSSVILRFLARITDLLILVLALQIWGIIAPDQYEVYIPWIVILGAQMKLLDKYGQSLGKMIFGIKIVDIDDHKIPNFFRSAIIRETILFLLMGFSQIYYLFSKQHQCLHDFVARTIVIKS